ncbi:hypothetical protein AGLY_004336 [Aphis glycines]|uniref:Uncharacterized protein n=1 Tax=Aphis glycines TaxID=307491 RepID=A0A6G0TYP7_APHGL|nr:hypothetical protein AGLY_004336 [Aphis glycines]
MNYDKNKIDLQEVYRWYINVLSASFYSKSPAILQCSQLHFKPCDLTRISQFSFFKNLQDMSPSAFEPTIIDRFSGSGNSIYMDSALCYNICSLKIFLLILKIRLFLPQFFNYLLQFYFKNVNKKMDYCNRNICVLENTKTLRDNPKQNTHHQFTYQGNLKPCNLNKVQETVIRSFAIRCLCVKKIATIPTHRGDACKYIASSFREFQGQQIVFLFLDEQSKAAHLTVICWSVTLLVKTLKMPIIMLKQKKDLRRTPSYLLYRIGDMTFWLSYHKLEFEQFPYIISCCQANIPVATFFEYNINANNYGKLVTMQPYGRWVTLCCTVPKYPVDLGCRKGHYNNGCEMKSFTSNLDLFSGFGTSQIILNFILFLVEKHYMLFFVMHYDVLCKRIKDVFLRFIAIYVANKNVFEFGALYRFNGFL